MSVASNSEYDPYPDDGPNDNPYSEHDDDEEPSEPMIQPPRELPKVPEAEITTTPHPAETSRKPRAPQSRYRPRSLRSLLRLHHRRSAEGMMGRTAMRMRRPVVRIEGMIDLCKMNSGRKFTAVNTR